MPDTKSTDEEIGEEIGEDIGEDMITVTIDGKTYTLPEESEEQMFVQQEELKRFEIRLLDYAALSHRVPLHSALNCARSSISHSPRQYPSPRPLCSYMTSACASIYRNYSSLTLLKRPEH